MDDFQPEQLKFGQLIEIQVARRAPRASRVRIREPFLKGPVSMRWLRNASALPGKALAVGIEVHHLVGMKKVTRVALNLSRMARNGVSRWAASRGLAELEEAGLVLVERHSGRRPIVTLLQYEASDTDGGAESLARTMQ